MSKETALANKIKSLKTAKGFTVTTESERQNVSRIAKRMKQFGLIEFDVVTKSDGANGFKVAAI